jgi:hypothetical protein
MISAVDVSLADNGDDVLVDKLPYAVTNRAFFFREREVDVEDVFCCHGV